MAQKRKRPASTDAAAAQQSHTSIGNTSRKSIRDFTDVADSDDEFHLQRDRVAFADAEGDPGAKRRRRGAEEEEFLEDDEEEVLGVGSDEDGLSEEEDGDDDEVVGLAKEDIYGADEIETEEQALEEEREARRLQKRQLGTMRAADYGFDEEEWRGEGKDEKVSEKSGREAGGTVTETLPVLKVGDEMGTAERLKLLRTRYPEFEHLRREVLCLTEEHGELMRDVGPESDAVRGPNAATKLRAASAYLGALTMYFALLSSPAATGSADVVAYPAAQLREHPVMDSLLRCREVWLRAKELPADPKLVSKAQAETSTLHNGTELGIDGIVAKSETENRPQKKSRAQRHAEAVEAAKEARRLEQVQKTEASLADLDALVASSTARKPRKRPATTAGVDDADSELGDETPLTAQEAEEKAKRKKSLRFYTSQIAQKANKRGAAGRNAGGDDDIPYRERLKDRQARLNAEAEKRGRRNEPGSTADLGDDSDEEDIRQAQAIREDNADDYYDLVASRTADKKATKTALASAQREAALRGGRVVQEDSVGADGKRKISYLIEKNKGLTPNRRKEVKNPRVKKRKKFEEKKKKLGSVRQVYKGGEGRGGYGGELTGIKKGLVKSVKL